MANAEKVVELGSRSRRKHAGGRPRACTPRVQATILEIAATGAHRAVIAASAGISLRTLNRFLQLAENARDKKENGRRLTKDEEEFCQFCLDFHKSEVAMQIALVEVVRKAAETNWRAALAFLERRWPDRWGRRRIVQIVTAEDVEWRSDEDDEPRRRRQRPATPARSAPLFTRAEIVAELERRGLPTRIFVD